MLTHLTVFVAIRVRPENAEKLANAHREVWEACGNEPESFLFDLLQEPKDSKPWKSGVKKDWAWFEKYQLSKSRKYLECLRQHRQRLSDWK